MLRQQPLQQEGGALNLRKLHKELVSTQTFFKPIGMGRNTQHRSIDRPKSPKVSFQPNTTPTFQACALEEDSAHRREDAAKKRAIRTAQSYDEFRHRVACAHLTPLRYGRENGRESARRSVDAGGGTAQFK